MPARRAPAPPPRLWPAYLILATAAAALAAIWLPSDFPGSMSQPTLSVIVLLAAALLLLGWWLFFSRTGFLTRLASLLALVAFAGTASLVIEYRGLSGDLVPRFGWRGRPTPAPVPPESSPSPQPEPAAAPTQAPAAPEASREPSPAAPAATPSHSTPPRAATAQVTGAATGASAARVEFPQFLGPNRDATVRGASLVRDWGSSPPVALWRQPIGKGWSGFAVADGLAVTLEQRDGRERVVAYDLATGRTRWSHRGGEGFESAMAGDGPRATPAIADGRVYTLGVNGKLTALELATGRVLFEKDVLADNGARRPEHGVASSPLLVDGAVVVLAGGAGGRSLVAYDALSGERRWSAGDDPAAYSSPRLATIGGVRQILVLTGRHLAGHDARTGRLLWQDPWTERAEKVSQPVVLDGDRVFVSMGYGVGGRMVKVSASPGGGLQAEVLWRTQQLKAKFTQVVAHRGFLYGLDEGVLVCLDPATGERRWKSGRYGHGQVLLVDDLLLVQAEDGEVAMVDPRPDGLAELGRFQAVSGRAWATPALAGDRLLVRGDVEAACYRLPTAAAPRERAAAGGR